MRDVAILQKSVATVERPPVPREAPPYAVVLANGDPEGLRPVTSRDCAAMLPIAGRPLVQLTIEALGAADFRAAMVVLGSRGASIEHFLGTGERWGINLDYLRVGEDDDDTSVLARLRTGLEGDLLVVRPDVLRGPHVVGAFLAAAPRERSCWAEIGGRPAGMALLLRDDAHALDLPDGDGCAGWERVGQRVVVEGATSSRIESVEDYQRASLQGAADRLASAAQQWRGRDESSAPARARAGRAGKFDSLVDEGHLTRDQLVSATVQARGQGVSVESALLEHHGIREALIERALSTYYRRPYAPLADARASSPELLGDLPVPRLRANAWVPIHREGDAVTVAVDDPHDLHKVDAIESVLRPLKVVLVVAVRERILRAIDRASRAADRQETVGAILGGLVVEDAAADPDAVPLEVNENDSAVVRLANQIIVDAHRARASDIHLEPRGSARETHIRFRVDGTCIDYQRIPSALRGSLVARLKIMAGLDIAERRKPQDGKIRIRSQERELELRVATVPTVGGNEDVVLRLLGSAGPFPLDRLGLTERNLRSLKTIAEKPYGLILCVGPTGSGKTTSLHAVLGQLNTAGRKIWTAEDPVEITQDGLRQVQVRPKIGYTFAAAMRAFLRADPDVIMVGEMRDQETASLAIEASLTGHLVLSTLHTNSATETIVRLLDLGLDPFNFADALLGVLAQRLVKRLCLDCRQPYHPAKPEWDELAEAFGREAFEAAGHRHAADIQLYRSRGCASCGGTGYRGRVAIHELLVATDAIKRQMQKRARVARLLTRASKEGMTTLVQDGVLKVLTGLTDLAQVRAAAIR